MEYIYSTKNYKKLLFTDSGTGTYFTSKYISGLSIPGFDRYNLETSRKLSLKSNIWLIATDDKDDEYNVIEDEDFTDLAALKYMYSINKFNINLTFMDYPFDVLRFAKKKDFFIGRAYKSIVESKYAINMNDKIQSSTVHSSIYADSWTAVKWFLENGFKFDRDRISEYVVKKDMFHIKFLIDNGMQTNVVMVDNTLKYNNVTLLKYLYKQYEKFIQLKSRFVIENGHINSAKYLHNKGVTFKASKYREINYRNMNLSSLQWLYDNGIRPTSKDAAEMINFNFQGFKFLWEHGIRPSEVVIKNIIVANFMPMFADFLVKHRET
jgi:hypothetical protein